MCLFDLVTFWYILFINVHIHYSFLGNSPTCRSAKTRVSFRGGRLRSRCWWTTLKRHNCRVSHAWWTSNASAKRFWGGRGEGLGFQKGFRSQSTNQANQVGAFILRFPFLFRVTIMTVTIDRVLSWNSLKPPRRNPAKVGKERHPTHVSIKRSQVDLVFGLHHLEKTPLRWVPEPGQGLLALGWILACILLTTIY